MTTMGSVLRVVSLVVSLLAGFSVQADETRDANRYAAFAQSAPETAEGQSATLLPDGTWLLAGGWTAPSGISGEATVLDAAGATRIPTAGRLAMPRAWHSATVLPSGQVLILGGVDATGNIISAPELFDPGSRRFRTLRGTSFAPRAHHTATLLTTGEVLIAGGEPDRLPELWNPETNALRTSSDALYGPRAGHAAALLPSSPVLMWGGNAPDGQPVDFAELYLPATDRFRLADEAGAGELLAHADPEAAPEIAESVPAQRALDVPLDVRPAVRFTKPLDVKTLSADTVTLYGPQGVVPGSVIAAEGGMLLFVRPRQPLNPDGAYTLFVRGAADMRGLQLPFTAIGFRTRALSTAGGAPGQSKAAPERVQPAGASTPPKSSLGVWQPGESQFKHSWRLGGKAHASTAPLLSAPAGVTALSGRVLLQDGTPLVGVDVYVDARHASTDAEGRFLLTQIKPGHNELVVNGRTANTDEATYGQFVIGVKAKKGDTTALDDTVWMPVIDEAAAVNIPSPTTADLVITTPRIPGLELHIPKDTVIRERDGSVVTRLSITPVPADRAPFPTPGTDVYFTIQPGGAYLTSASANKKLPGARLVYPNPKGHPAGRQLDFLHYDPSGKGWFVYGKGRVNQSGDKVEPDEGLTVYQFTGAMFAPGTAAPGEAPPPDDCSGRGDPVSCASGIFLHHKTDLVLADVIPIELTRTYQSADTAQRAWGRGFTHPYSMYVYSPSFSSSATLTLVLANGSGLVYERTPTSPATGWTGAYFRHTSSPGKYRGSTIVYLNGQLVLTLRTGEVYKFEAETTYYAHSLREFKDRNGNTLRVIPKGPTGTDAELTPIKSIVSPNGRSITFEYASGSMTRIAKVTDSSGRSVLYDYDASATRLTKVTYPDGTTEQYTYNSSGRMESVINERGTTVVTNVYDTKNRVTRQTFADTGTFTFAYTEGANGKITQTDITDPLGMVERLEFDSKGYITKKTLALGTAEQQVTSYTLDSSNHLPLAVTDNLNRATTYTYDSNSNPTSVTLLVGTPNAATVSFTYEPNFLQIASITDPLNHTTRYTYDAKGNLTQVIDALNQTVVQISHDSQGRPVQVQNALNQATSLSYTGADLTSATDALGRTMRASHDSLGRVRELTDPLGTRVSYEYDAGDRLTKATDGLGNVTTLSYDAASNLTAVTDARGGVTTFAYDNRNRPVTRADALNQSESFVYDKNGNVIQSTDRKGQINEFVYDILGRPIAARYKKTVQKGNKPPIYESTISYSYDGADRLKQAVDSVAGTVTLGYDDFDRVISHATPKGTVSYSYDTAGRRRTMTAGTQPQTTYTYDDTDRLTQIVQGSSSVGFGYDAAGRRTSLTLPNGLVVNYGIDAAGQLTSIRYMNGASLLGDLTYAYDATGQRVSMGGSFARTALPAAVSSASYNAGNRLTNWAGTAMAYDANGNMTSNGSLNMSWNARDQLTGTSGASSASFVYDPLGRRQQKTVGGITTGFLYDGINPVQEQGGAGADLLTGLGVDEYFGRTDGAGMRVLLSDALGSTVALADSSAVIRTSLTYEPYGKTTSSGDTPATAYQYTGRENDGTGLYYYRARYYSPSHSRFASEDPIGLNGGTNLYAYVSGNPVSYTDPSGQLPILPFVIGAAAGAIGVSDDLHDAAASAAQYWADRQVATGNWGYGLLGGLAALADPCNAGKTSAVLGVGAALGGYLGRPFWQYYPAGNSAYSSSWMTRGWGWKPPYSVGPQAAERLALPPYNPATAVRPVNPSPFEYVGGPRPVSPANGQPGGGIEYRFGGFP